VIVANSFIPVFILCDCKSLTSVCCDAGDDWRACDPCHLCQCLSSPHFSRLWHSLWCRAKAGAPCSQSARIPNVPSSFDTFTWASSSISARPSAWKCRTGTLARYFMSVSGSVISAQGR
jgi:hypothetical protein